MFDLSAAKWKFAVNLGTGLEVVSAQYKLNTQSSKWLWSGLAGVVNVVVTNKQSRSRCS